MIHECSQCHGLINVKLCNCGQTDLQRLCAVLDELGIENWIQDENTSYQRLWIKTNMDLESTTLQFAFDSKGRLIR